MKHSIPFALVVLLLITSCKSTRKAQKAPDISMDTPTEGFYSDTLSTGKVDDGWILTFQDPQLEAVVQEGLQNNPSLAAAAANVNAAAGFVVIAGSKMKPSLSLGGPITTEGSTNTDAATSAGAGLVLSWEADIWGKLAAGKAAAEADAVAAAANYEYGRQSFVAQIARTYFITIETWIQMSLADSVVGLYELNLKLVEDQFAQGRASEQDLALIKADLASAKDAYKSSQGAYADAKRALELLLGRYPSAQIEVPEILASIPPYPASGLPSELLERRPDVVAAERQVGAAFERVNEAKAAQLPSLRLDANLASFLNPTSTLWSVGAGFLLPVTQGGALRANVEIQTFQQEAAVANYRDVALNAFGEVESSINNEHIFESREAYITEVRDNSVKAYKLSLDQYNVGAIDLLSVLILQQRAINAQKLLINTTNNRLIQRVNTHLALGGSFETSEAEEQE